MKQRTITYIKISESLTFYSHLRSNDKLRLKRDVCIQEEIDGCTDVRGYYGVSEASILRLAKIQEKLAK